MKRLKILAALGAALAATFAATAPLAEAAVGSASITGGRRRSTSTAPMTT
jgi:hypothetical protein